MNSYFLQTTFACFIKEFFSVFILYLFNYSSPLLSTNSRLSEGRIRRSSPQNLSADLHLLQDPPLLGVQCLIDP